MTLKEFLQAVVRELEQKKIKYCLVGGLAASGYRKEERLTKDLDFIIKSDNDEILVAKEILKLFGLSSKIIRKADLDGGPLFAIKRKNTEPRIVTGRNSENNRAIGLDFLLPTFSWFNNAIERGQFNKIDFGFLKIPTITVEDLILAKLDAINTSSKREKDIDDIRSIFEAKHELDLAYLVSQMKSLKLFFPENLKDDIPSSLLKISKQIKKEKYAK